MHITITPLASAGLVLVLLGIAVYLGGIARAVIRIGQQYSREMPGGIGLRLTAAFAMAARLWPALLVIAAGAALIVVAR